MLEGWWFDLVEVKMSLFHMSLCSADGDTDLLDFSHRAHVVHFDGSLIFSMWRFNKKLQFKGLTPCLTWSWYWHRSSSSQDVVILLACQLVYMTEWCLEFTLVSVCLSLKCEDSLYQTITSVSLKCFLTWPNMNENFSFLLLLSHA